MHKGHSAVTAIILSVLASPAMLAQSESTPDTRMSFFITSVGMGKAGNLGGLAGADRHCQTARRIGGRRRPNVARVSQHQCNRTSPRSTPAIGSARAVVQRAKGRRRERPGASARRHARARAPGQQHHEGDGAHGTGRESRRRGRSPQSPRHDHRFTAGRHARIRTASRPHVSELDLQQPLQDRFRSATPTVSAAATCRGTPPTR